MVQERGAGVKKTWPRVSLQLSRPQRVFVKEKYETFDFFASSSLEGASVQCR